MASLKFSTPDEFASIANEYNRVCMACDDKPPSLPGLARLLGFSCKSKMEQWVSGKQLYEDVYEAARNHIEEWLVTKASSVDTKNSRGIEFILANQFKYANQQVVQIQGAFNMLLDKIVELIPKHVESENVEAFLADFRQVVAEVCDY